MVVVRPDKMSVAPQVREAWNTSKSAHGPWRLSQTPALSLALPARYFQDLGLPSLTEVRS